MAWTTTWTSRRSCADVQATDLPTSRPPADREVHRADLGPGAEGWFTGAVLAGVDDANLAHHRPHVPDRLARARARVGALIGADPARWTLMRQVHGSRAAVVDATVPAGAEVRDVDILVTSMVDRPLVVLTADCLPLLASGRHAVGVAHAGWRGIVDDVPGALVDALLALGEQPEDLRVVVGPAIGACCYEVGPEVLEQVEAVSPGAAARTRSGAPAVDLWRAARDRLHARGVSAVRHLERSGDEGWPCTSCTPGWFSHRRDAAAGRQAGIVVRRSASTAAHGASSSAARGEA